MLKFASITSAGIVESTDGTVYDIELEKNHFFAANGIITHNCRLKNMVKTREFNFTNGNMGVN